jgi:hypothetical protein
MHLTRKGDGGRFTVKDNVYDMERNVNVLL